MAFCSLRLPAVVRSEAILAAFSVICCESHDAQLLSVMHCITLLSRHVGINLSQTPDLLRLQQRLFQQLSGDEDIPSKLTKSVEMQISQLRKAAHGKVVLVILYSYPEVIPPLLPSLTGFTLYTVNVSESDDRGYCSNPAI